ncbi:MAG: glycosyl hydrolase family 18 protein [Candidatus Diapherotrites archaeon]|nr:glycosyl hydrolase family 18 protein [Candidatus Diapherotrites archaeon]
MRKIFFVFFLILPFVPAISIDCPDAKNDGTINVLDIVRLVKAMNQNDIAYDLTGDNKIDVQDLQAVADKIGASCTACAQGLVLDESGTNCIIDSSGNCGKWRILSHPTWTPDLQQYHYDNFNIFFHFNLEPQANGSTNLGGMDAQTARNFAQTAHSKNDLAILVVGGWGYGPEFNGATKNSNRAKFVQQITTAVRDYGYDGITMDWEDEVNNPNLVQTMKDLRTEFNKITPRPLLLIDICCDVTVDSIVQISPYVDSVNTMDYETVVQPYFSELTAAGVPASKIINGLGFYFDEGAYIKDEARARSEIQFVLDHEMKGVEVWDSSNITGSNDLRMKAISSMLGTTPACRPA